MRLFFLVAGVGLSGWTIVNLLPNRLKPQSIFSEVFDKLQNDDDVSAHV